LRGANIWQRQVYPELDGPEFLGPGPFGPPYTQEDLDQLSALGANYVNISHPGLFTETPPYLLDEAVQSNLDRLLGMIARADMFAVISFRTGPGRSEFTFVWDEVGDWFDASYLNDSLWQDQLAQDAWAEMWGYTAERYRDNPIVVGYDLMVEPNANEVGSHPLDDPLDLWNPEQFYAVHGGTLYDWNQLYPRITAAIRQVDADTPILVAGMGYSGVDWLPYLKPTGDSRTVYVVHQYAPYLYTHQWAEVEYSYPGEFDVDWDGEGDLVDRVWLETLLSTIDDFQSSHHVPVAVNEFGVVRWVPGAAFFMDDQVGLFEQLGMNHALWVWDPAWEAWNEGVNGFTFRFGPDPGSKQVVSSDLADVILKYWGRNTVRPSTYTATPVARPDLPVGPTILNCPLFPGDNIWNVPVNELPLDPNSDAYVDAIGADEPAHADFGSGLWEGEPIGIPYVVVAGMQPGIDVAFEYDDESDPGPYPIPPDPPIEGGPGSDGDRHILIVDQDNCLLYELYYAWPETDGSWNAGSGAVFDLNSNALRPAGWTSADAAGLPILPGLVRYEEVAAGEIRHAIRVTAPRTRQAYIWPARHYASDLTATRYPPMGQRFRLRADYDISGFSAEVQVILRALKTYGMILADNGAPWFISGVPDERWDNEVLHELHRLRGSDFEAVDVSTLMVDPDSGQALSP
jgi:hypothetical protein